MFCCSGFAATDVPELSRVMQLAAHGFDHQTDQRIRRGIRRQNRVDTNSVVPAH